MYTYSENFLKILLVPLLLLTSCTRSETLESAFQPIQVVGICGFVGKGRLPEDKPLPPASDSRFYKYCPDDDVWYLEIERDFLHEPQGLIFETMWYFKDEIYYRGGLGFAVYLDENQNIHPSPQANNVSNKNNEQAIVWNIVITHESPEIGLSQESLDFDKQFQKALTTQAPNHLPRKFYSEEKRGYVKTEDSDFYIYNYFINDKPFNSGFYTPFDIYVPKNLEKVYLSCTRPYLENQRGKCFVKDLSRQNSIITYEINRKKLSEFRKFHNSVRTFLSNRTLAAKP